MALTRGLGWTLGKSLRLGRRVARMTGRTGTVKPPRLGTNIRRLFQGRTWQTSAGKVATRTKRLEGFLERKGVTRRLAFRRRVKVGIGAAGIGGGAFAVHRRQQRLAPPLTTSY